MTKKKVVQIQKAPQVCKTHGLQYHDGVCDECTSPVSVELYNRVASQYRAEELADPNRKVTVESRFGILGLTKVDDLEYERGDMEMDNILLGDYDTKRTRTSISLGRMYALGIEIGFRLGQAAASAK